MRVTQGRPLNLSHTFLGDDEETPLTLTAVSATLTDGAGAVSAPVSATETTSVWSVTFPAQPLGPYVVTWTGDAGLTDTTDVEVVGGFLFTTQYARAAKKVLADASMFPASEIIEKREQVETEFQRIANRSFTTRARYRSFIVDGTGEELLLNPDAQAIETVTVNGVAVTDLTGWSVSNLGSISYPCEYVTATGTIRFCLGDAVMVRIRYGMTPTPSDIVRVALIRLVDIVNQEDSSIPDRATTFQPQEGGTFRLATAGTGPWETGIPEVDAVVKRYRLDGVLAAYVVG